MSIAIKFALILIVSLSSFSTYAAELTEASVMNFISELDTAISTRNPDAVGELMAENVDITGTVTAQGTKQSYQMNKAQYMEVLKATWAQAESYTYTAVFKPVVASNFRLCRLF